LVSLTGAIESITKKNCCNKRTRKNDDNDDVQGASDAPAAQCRSGK
jgi:hypothetical protein